MLQKLKTELKARDLDTTGKKADLAERLEAHLQPQPTEPSQQANGASSSAVAQNGSNETTAAKVSCPSLTPRLLIPVLCLQPGAGHSLGLSLTKSSSADKKTHRVVSTCP